MKLNLTLLFKELKVKNIKIFIIKIGVGKSAFINYIKNNFTILNEEYSFFSYKSIESNYNDSFVSIGFNINNHFIGLKIRELPINDDFAFNFVNNSNLVILMYDITNQKSYQQIDDLLNQIKENFQDKKFIICLLGNKNDLNSKRVIQENNAILYSKWKDWVEKDLRDNILRNLATALMNNPYTSPAGSVLNGLLSTFQGDNINNLLEDIIKIVYLSNNNDEDSCFKFINDDSIYNFAKNNSSYCSNKPKNQYMDKEYKKEVNNLNKRKCCKCQCCKCCCCIIF